MPQLLKSGKIVRKNVFFIAGSDSSALTWKMLSAVRTQGKVVAPGVGCERIYLCGRMMRNLTWNSIRGLAVKLQLGSLCTAVLLGTVLGLLVPAISGWSRFRLVFVLLTGVGLLGMLVVGDVRRVLMVSLAFIIPVSVSLSPLGKTVPYHPGGARAGLALYLYDFPLIGLVILWLLDALTKRRPIRFGSIDVVAVLLILWTTLSIYNSSHILLSMFEIMRMTKLYFLSFVVARNIRTRGDMQDVILALLAGLVLESAVGVLQYAVGVDLGIALPGSGMGKLDRVWGTVGWPNTFGAYAATILTVALALWLCGAGAGRVKTLVGVACVVGFCPLILTFSRGAWIALLAGVAVSLFLGWRMACLDTRSFARLTTIALSVAIVGALFARPVAARLAEVHPGMPVIVDRMKLNQVALNMIAAHPLLGVGINTFVNVMQEYDTTGITALFPSPVHNVYLLVAAETGLIGLGLFLLLILFTVLEGLQAAKSDERFLSACAIGVLGGLVVLMVSNLADDHLRTDVLYALFWLLIGLAVAIRERASLHGFEADSMGDCHENRCTCV